MTRDEVMALSDEELRAQAILTMGRANGTRLLGFCPTKKRPLKTVLDEAGEPDYPHDIAAAWKLVKQLERDGFKTSVHTGMIDPRTGDVLDDSSAAIWNHDDIYWVGTAGPGESPLAITRAFVLAMTQEKP
jgi:hypothetical protein